MGRIGRRRVNKTIPKVAGQFARRQRESFGNQVERKRAPPARIVPEQLANGPRRQRGHNCCKRRPKGSPLHWPGGWRAGRRMAQRAAAAARGRSSGAPRYATLGPAGAKVCGASLPAFACKRSAEEKKRERARAPETEAGATYFGRRAPSSSRGRFAARLPRSSWRKSRRPIGFVLMFAHLPPPLLLLRRRRRPRRLSCPACCRRPFGGASLQAHLFAAAPPPRSRPDAVAAAAAVADGAKLGHGWLDADYCFGC